MGANKDKLLKECLEILEEYDRGADLISRIKLEIVEPVGMQFNRDLDKLELGGQTYYLPKTWPSDLEEPEKPALTPHEVEVFKLLDQIDIAIEKTTHINGRYTIEISGDQCWGDSKFEATERLLLMRKTTKGE